MSRVRGAARWHRWQEHRTATAAALTVAFVAALLVRGGGDDTAGTAARRGSGTQSARPTGQRDAASPPAAPTASPAPPPADCPRRVLAGMSRAERAGQVVMAGTTVGGLDAFATVVRQNHLGGVFVIGRSTASRSLVRRRVDAVQRVAVRDTGVPVHVAVDQEGGKVQTLGGRDHPAIPSAVAQSRWTAATLTRRTTGWAADLRETGVTMDLAPVADTVPVGTEADNPPIGKAERQYGGTPGDVAVRVQAVATALQASGVLATAKHFPGLGRVRVNTDYGRTAVDPVTHERDSHLVPFAAAIRAGTGAVMMSSARYPRLDPARPAVFSRSIVTGLLRERLGFTGLVVSDDLGAAAAVRDVPVGERAVRFVAAGGDLVLTVRGADARPMTRALAAEARSSPTFARRLDDAAGHVLASKQRMGLLRCPAATGAAGGA